MPLTDFVLNSIRKNKKTTLHIPLEMMGRIMSSSTYNFNEFKTYLSFAFRTSGNCKLNTEIKTEVLNDLGISERTLNKHIKSLVIKGYFGYNPKTNTLFINGLSKIKRLVFIENNFDERILGNVSFPVNIFDLNKLKFLTFSAMEQLILKHQSKYKNRLKFNEYLVDNNLSERYKNGNVSVKKQIKKIYLSEKKSKGDSIKKVNPNHFDSNLFIDDRDYLGVSNSFISNEFKRTKSWGSKMKKESSKINLLKYRKKSKFINSFPLTFNVRRYIAINFPESYNFFYTKKENDKISVYQRGYDEIISNVKLTTRRLK